MRSWATCRVNQLQVATVQSVTNFGPVLTRLPARTLRVLLVDGNARFGRGTEDLKEPYRPTSTSAHVTCVETTRTVPFSQNLFETCSPSAINTLTILQVTRITDTTTARVLTLLRSLQLVLPRQDVVSLGSRLERPCRMFPPRFIAIMCLLLHVSLDLRCPAAAPRRLPRDQDRLAHAVLL